MTFIYLPVPLPFPVYGLVGNPLDLTVCSLYRRGAGDRLTSVGLTFSSPRYPDVRENFELGSLDAKDRSFRRMPRERGSAAFWEGECRIAGQLFRGVIDRWSSPQEFAQMLPPGFSLPEWEMFYDLEGEEPTCTARSRVHRLRKCLNSCKVQSWSMTTLIFWSSTSGS